MNDITLTSTFDQKKQSSSHGTTAIAHVDGSVSLWDLNMRKLISSKKLHE